ncbi:uncharacterized protein LOC107627080 [Arachis ipaensis]|uniref:uncharacterized protein LOC107627080 n=1 Tax=Arachis ipaensis TaxID=130454 RepID=UPI0007AF0BBE|nr:uncharacterized protein LOC107627080 [Arachis ipaensis]
MTPPPGLCVDKGQVCKLKTSLYGLKQASRLWNNKLKSVLIELGYKQCRSNYSLFTKHSDHGFTAILVYVDDLVLAGNDMREINIIKRVLHDRFRIKDIGDLKFFLGFEVAQSNRGIALYQRKYVVDILTDFGFINCKPISTSMDYSAKLRQDSGTLLPHATRYCKLVGKLLYLKNTRPDISFAISRLSQFFDKPTNVHLHAAHRILRYLKSAPAQGLFFPTSSDLCITGFSDLDWATSPDTRRSTSAYYFYLGSSLISWKSKNQCIISCSSSEAEYRVLAAATTEAIWLGYLMKDLGMPLTKLISLFCDS